MELISQEILYIVDNIVFATFLICLPISIYFLYESVNRFVELYKSFEYYEEKSASYEKDLNNLKDFIKHHLEEQRKNTFEMLHDSRMAHEKRIKQYIDDFNKNKDET
jgi:hypothetical protein